LNELRAWKPDGVFCPVAQIDKFSQLRVPMVTYAANVDPGRVPAAISEDPGAGRLAAQHLLGSGHRHFAFCGYSGCLWSHERCEAFCALVEDAGFEVDVYHPRRKVWAKEEPHVRRWLESLPKPVGMLCANDDRAEYLLEACRVLGYSVPEDVSVIGVDDDQYVCELQNPPLSSVKMASDRAGYDAAALLDQMMCGEEKMSGQRITAHVMGVTVRQSTSVLMVRDVEVRKALRFIRENAGRLIQVADVVRVTGLCHRALNDRFHDELGSTILKQLTLARIAYIARLLTETDMRIHEIATTVGYENDHHFSRYFKRATGLTPDAYRRKSLPP
jgi:LacI family transcriptional regulator